MSNDHQTRTRKMPKLYFPIRRKHFTKDGTPKKNLSARQAANCRHDGLDTYLCPLCGNTHAGNPPAPTKAER